MQQTNESLICGILKFIQSKPKMEKKMNRQTLCIKTEKYKTLAEAGEELLQENPENWECLWGPEHKDFINGRCGHCGESPKGD